MHAERPYDAFVLTRGGGSLEELMAFNDERVVRALFASRIPTLVGIGHERDVTLAEEVADVRGSTPTDCARRLVPDREDVLYELATLQETIDSRMQEVITQKQERIVRTVDAVDRWFGRLRERHGMQAMRFEHGFTTWHRNLVERVTSIERLCQSFNPTLVLKRGYAIVRDGKGKPMVSVKQLLPREEVTVQLQDGAVPAMIINTNQPRLL
jgi:exodeoxyribonuclease VII large subunit